MRICLPDDPVGAGRKSLDHEESEEFKEEYKEHNKKHNKERKGSVCPEEHNQQRGASISEEASEVSSRIDARRLTRNSFGREFGTRIRQAPESTAKKALDFNSTVGSRRLSTRVYHSTHSISNIPSNIRRIFPADILPLAGQQSTPGRGIHRART
eukprot:8445387-Pyramimonas_sp.AAC.2